MVIAQMYKNAVQPATAFLYGQRTGFLHTASRMLAAEKLKALRLSIPGEPGVRKIAAAMGKPDTPNFYGYYESAAFTKSELPLPIARDIAAAFEQLGGDAGAVLALAGVGEAQVILSRPEGGQPLLIPAMIAVPSEEALTAMIAGLLRSVDLHDAAAEHAATLARRFPAAFAQVSGPPPHQGKDAPAILGERQSPPAEPHPDTLR